VRVEPSGDLQRPMGVKILVLTIAAGLVAACSGAPGPSATTSASPYRSVPVTGALAGVVRGYGGPINPTTKQPAATGQPMPSFVVKLLQGGSVVATAMSDPSGYYAFLHVQPGTYSLACAGSEKVTVRVGMTSSVDCDVNLA